MKKLARAIVKMRMDLSLEGAKQQAAEYLTAIEGYPAAWLDYDHE